MLELFCTPEYGYCDDLEGKLRELELEYRMVTLPDGSLIPGEGALRLAGVALRNGVRLVSGQAEVAAYIEELRYAVENWNWFASDACYVDDSGENC